MSTSGGSRGELQIAHTILGTNGLATLGSVPVTIPVLNPLGRLLVATQYVAQFLHTDATFDFSGDHLTLKDSAGGNLLEPSMQILTTDQTEAEPVVTAQRNTASMAGAGFVLGTKTNTDPTRTGPMFLITVQAGGLGYAVGDTGSVDNNGTGGTYTVLAIGALGVVTQVAVDARGANYDTAHNPHSTTPGGFQPGVGAGLTVNVTAIFNGTAELMVAVAYLAIPPI